MNDLTVSLPNAGPPAVKLSSKEKAAVVVRLLLSHGALPALSALPEDKQTELALQMAKMAPVDQDTVTMVATEFADEIERIGLSFPTGLEGALGLLDGVISEEATSQLKKMSPGTYRRNPWEEIENAELDRLVAFLDGESIEIAAVVLSKLNVTRAAEVLGKLPGEKSRRITYAISTTSQVSPSVVLRIGTSLAEQLSTRPVVAFSDGPVKRVGNILNYAPAGLRDEMLDGLDSEDKEFADEVRAAIFTFANIAERISPRDVPRIQRDLDQDDLTLIVAGATGADQASVDFILSNISKRMAENIRDDAKELGDAATEDMEAAMIRVVGVIRELEAQGEIFYVAKDG